MHIKSFGCSFIWGSELSDCDPTGPYSQVSRLTWPALVAQSLGANYNCYANPGSGNLQIASRVIDHAASAAPEDVFVIGWTWIERFDYMIDRPGSRPGWSTICPVSDSLEAEAFYRHVHSEPWDKLRNLMIMTNVLNLLKNRNIPFVMTLMDELLLDKQWHVTPAISIMQAEIAPYIQRFDGVDFLTWSKQQGYPITQVGHPLEAAHAAAADLMLPMISDAIQHRA